MPYPSPDTNRTYADLADLVLTVARAVHARAHVDPEILRLTTTEIDVMRFIDHHPDTCPSAVATAVGIQRSNVSPVLRTLKAKGLIERRVNPTDSRHAALRSTARSAENLGRLRRAWAQILDGALGDQVTAEELATTLAVLDRINQGLERRAGH